MGCPYAKFPVPSPNVNLLLASHSFSKLDNWEIGAVSGYL